MTAPARCSKRLTIGPCRAGADSCCQWCGTELGGAAAERVLSQLKTAVSARDWGAASQAYETLRFGHGWRYARFAAEFGSFRWEEISEEMDEHEENER